MNRLYATCERACISNPRDKYHTKMYETLVDYNDRNDLPVSNDNIRQQIYKFIVEEEVDANNMTLDTHSVTADIFSQMLITPNT